MKKIITTFIAFALVVSIGASFEPASAASRPAKVTGVKYSKTSCEVTFKWKKAKRAKKYQVYQYKKSKKKYVRVRTTAKRKTTIKKLKPNKVYKFKIRAINGSRKGNWSRVIKVKTRKPVTHKTPVSPKGTKFNVGDTYVIKNGDDNIKLTITKYDRYDSVTDVYGKTSDGGTYIYTNDADGDNTFLEITYPGYTSHFTHDSNGDVVDFEGIAYEFRVKDSNTKVYWTLDGTCPKIGQADYTGYSKWCRLGVPLSDEYDYDLKMHLINQYEMKDNLHPKTKLRGTAAKGVSYIWTEPHDSTVGYEWFKVYYGTKLIYEYKFKH